MRNLLMRVTFGALLTGALLVGAPQEAAADECGRCYKFGQHGWGCVGFPLTWACYEEADSCIDTSGGCTF